MLKWLILAAFFPSLALAQGLPVQTALPVSDFADILPDATEARLVKQLDKARSETGVEVVLVTMNRRADYGGAGQSIEDYAKLLFNTWGIGDRKRNDGILILVAKDDREMRIQLGKGFSRDWNAVAQGVIDQSFLPGFRANTYPTAIEAGVSATIVRIARPFAAGNTAPRFISPQPKTDTNEGPIFGLIFLGVIFLAARHFIGDLMVRFKPCPQCHARTLERTRTVLERSTTYSSGRGEMTTTCRNCDYRFVQAYTIAKDSDSSDRSSRSGGSSGGGRSSGGGASGRW